MGPLPLYWLGTSWWCSGLCVVAPLSFVFVFFHFHAVSAVADWFCLVLLRVYSIHVYPLWKRVWALRLALFSFVFCLILFSFSFMHFLLLTLSYFYMRFLLCLSFHLVWLFFPSLNSCCWHFLLFLFSFHRVSSYSFSLLYFYTKGFGPSWAK